MRPRRRRRAGRDRRRRACSLPARRCPPTPWTAAPSHTATPYQYASFCSPPESVTMTRACEASAAKSRYESGSTKRTCPRDSPCDRSASRVRGWAGKITGSSIASSPATMRPSRGSTTFASRWIVATTYVPARAASRRSTSGALPRDRGEREARVGHDIADDRDRPGHAFRFEDAARALVRAEQQVGDRVDLDARVLLRHRHVAGAHPRLHVRERDAGLPRRPRAPASVEFVSPKTTAASGRSRSSASTIPGSIVSTSRVCASSRYAGSASPSSSKKTSDSSRS